MSAFWGVVLLRVLLGLCLLAYLAYAGIAVWAARQWRRARPPQDQNWTPPVTILKPVCGVDAEAWENFVSFCHLDYPADRVQLLFGALDPDDPALALARRLQADYPDRDIGIVCSPPTARVGPNRKVCNLAAMHPHARHDLLVLCDSDMRVAPDYLRRLVAPFAPGAAIPPRERKKGGFHNDFQDDGGDDRKDRAESSVQDRVRNGSVGAPVGLVTCPYRGCQARSFAAALEALGIGADFIPSALVSRALEGVSFAFGSTIALPRSVLAELGGFEALTDELADDFRLGRGVWKAGYTVVVSDYVVDDVLGPERFRAMWARRLRWARTIRACRPAGHAGACITHGFVLSLLLLGATGGAPLGWAALAVVTGVRWSSALLIARFTQDPSIARFLPLLPVSDLLSFALYVGSFCGQHIVWRGERFRLLPGGKLAPEHASEHGVNRTRDRDPSP